MSAPGAQSTISDTQQHAGRDAYITTTNHNHHYGNNVFSGPDPLANLREHTALGALHDAAERPDPPRCHENTRVAVQERIDLWARDTSVEAQPILWLNGPAGAGKSAICQTLIERWKEDGHIVSDFFLWRTAAKRNQKTYVVPTIAFQLIEPLPETKPLIAEAVRDGSIFEKNLKTQVERLIVNPILKSRANARLVIVVIDGLDECREDIPEKDGRRGRTHEDQQREILEAIAFASQKVPFLRFLIASRPEPQIRKSFGSGPLTALSFSLSLNDEQDASADIRLYLGCKFAEIRSAYPGRIPSSWPSKEQIEMLVEKSTGQFIYPSTVVKHVSQLRRHPVTSLQEVLALQSKSDDQAGHPLAELDALYTFVLGTVDRDSLPTVRELLGLMAHFPENIHRYHPLNIFKGIRLGHNTGCIEKFLFLKAGELSICLTDLHSIISLTGNIRDRGNLEDKYPNEDVDEDDFLNIRSFHATFLEYLQEQSRSGDYFISEEEADLQAIFFLLKHANTGHRSPPDPRVYSLHQLYDILGHRLGDCAPSHDHMKSIWSHFRDEIGDYSTFSGPNMRLQATQSASRGKRQKYFQGQISEYMDKESWMYLLDYLQRCNIPEFEPSKERRRAIGNHLVHLLKLTDPSEYRDHEYVSSTDDLTDTEEEEEEEGSKEFPSPAHAQATESPREESSPPQEINSRALMSPGTATGQTDVTGAKKRKEKSRVRQFLSGLHAKVFSGRKRSSSRA